MSERYEDFELEAALYDAKNMTDLTTDWANRALKIEGAETPVLDDEEIRLLYFALNEIRRLVGAADKIFHRNDQKERANV